MEQLFNIRELSAVYRLYAESTNDVILKTDQDGCILDASPAIERFNLLPPARLRGGHLLDLVHPSRADRVMAELQAATKGGYLGSWVEFPERTPRTPQRWFAIRSRGLLNELDRIYGAISIIRNIDDRRAMDERLFATAMTDPLTGLTNRAALVAMLDHMIASEVDGCLALFDIDHFKAINLRYSHSIGDQVLIAFADLLRRLVRSQDIISRVSGESFGVLLPRASETEGALIASRVVTSLAESCGRPDEAGLPINASAGVVLVRNTIDETMRFAELTLALAKAKGGGRVEIEKRGSHSTGAFSSTRRRA